MPFLSDDCHQRSFIDDDKRRMTKCARLISEAHEIDPNIPICNSPCPIPLNTKNVKVAIHDSCLMTLTSEEAIRDGLLRKVKLTLGYF